MSLFVPKIFPCYDICLMAKFLFLAYISILVMYMYIYGGGMCTWEQMLTKVNRKKASESLEQAVEVS